MSDTILTESLWGEEFNIEEKVKEKTKKTLSKIASAEKTTVTKTKTGRTKVSKSLTKKERLDLITEEVLKQLGHYKDKTIVIKDFDTYINYIKEALHVGRIAIDTETNNSLDPITCKLMGLCLYYPGGKQAYVPVNHRDPDTEIRLDWQLTEAQIAEGLNLIINQRPKYTDYNGPLSYSEWYNQFIVPKLTKDYVRSETHNGKFDFEVIKCTCDVKIPIDWDSLIGCKLIDENEKSAALKTQYVEKIDPNEPDYHIDHLFEGVEYADVDPAIFALYAATDSFKTAKLTEYQLTLLTKKENMDILKLATNIEMPLVTVIAEMELAGMDVDQEYAQLLSKKYHNKLDAIDKKIADELKELEPKVNAWRLTPEANARPKKKSGEGEGKSKSEQLTDPINLASPTQLAILFYDVLNCPAVDKKQPRATGEDALKAISEKLNLSICKLIIERREIVKLLTTYIDVIPELARRWPDGRVRTHFNAYGAATGRLSSSDPINFQNIPSHNREIRMLFKSKQSEQSVELNENQLNVKRFDYVNTPTGWQFASKLKQGDLIVLDCEDGTVENATIRTIELNNNSEYIITV